MRTHEIMETWLGVRRVAKLYYPNQPIDCPGYNSIYIYLRSGSTDLNGTYFWVGKHRTGLLIFKFPEIWDGSQGIASRAALHKKCLVLLALAFQVHLRLKTKLELTKCWNAFSNVFGGARVTVRCCVCDWIGDTRERGLLSQHAWYTQVAIRCGEALYCSYIFSPSPAALCTVLQLWDAFISYQIWPLLQWKLNCGLFGVLLERGWCSG